MLETREQTEGEKKLSQLLGEYMEEKKKNPEGFLEISTVLMCAGDSKAMDEYMVSKQFGFIRRLVQSDKIDFEGMSGHGKIISYLTDKKDYKWDDVKEGVVLMLLSIQDEPVKFLSDILKDE